MRNKKFIVFLIFAALAGVIVFAFCYSIYNIVCTYKLDKSEKSYEYAEASIQKSSGRRIIYHYFIQLDNDNKIYRKDLRFVSKIVEKYYIPERNIYLLEVKFNDKKSYFIIKDHIVSTYKTHFSTLLIIFIAVIAGFIVYICAKFKKQ